MASDYLKDILLNNIKENKPTKSKKVSTVKEHSSVLDNIKSFLNNKPIKEADEVIGLTPTKPTPTKQVNIVKQTIAPVMSPTIDDIEVTTEDYPDYEVVNMSKINDLDYLLNMKEPEEYSNAISYNTNNPIQIDTVGDEYKSYDDTSDEVITTNIVDEPVEIVSLDINSIPEVDFDIASVVNNINGNIAFEEYDEVLANKEISPVRNEVTPSVKKEVTREVVSEPIIDINNIPAVEFDMDKFMEEMNNRISSIEVDGNDLDYTEEIGE